MLPTHSAHTQAPLRWPTLLLLYLGPGLLMTLFYVLTAPRLLALGLPAVWGLLLGALVIVVPVELGILLVYAYRRTGRLQLRAALPANSPLSRRQALIWVPVAIVAAFLLPGIGVLIEPWVRATFFGWLPPWFLAGLTTLPTYSPLIQCATVLLWLVSVVLAGPIVEELYFRGFLLPRTASGHWIAPLLNVLLFALYHFWQPYALLTIFLFTLPLAYLVWWKHDVRLSIIAHCVINLIAFIGLAAGIVQR